MKNIIFDFGGVLINLDRSCCIQNFKQLGFGGIEDLIGPFYQQGHFMQLEKGMITPAEFRNMIREYAGKPFTDRQIDDAWNSFLLDVPSYKWDALLALNQKYDVYLLSNTNAIHWEWSCRNVFPYNGFTEKDYFKEIFLSYEMKLAKPDTAIFKAVLNQTSIVPEETLFIDDSEDNCRAAYSLGIATYCCQPGEDWRHLFT